MAARFDLERAANLLEPFAHTPEPDAESTNAPHQLSDEIRRHASPAVLDLERQPVTRDPKANARGRTVGMTMNVDQGLLNHAEERRLDVLRQAFQELGQVEVDPDAASISEPLRVPTQRRQQAGLVKEWGMEQIGQRADLGHRAIGELDAFGEERALGVGEPIRRSDQTRQQHLQPGEVLGGGFVEHSRDASPFVVLCVHETICQGPQRLLGLPRLGHVLRRAEDADRIPERIAHEISTRMEYALLSIATAHSVVEAVGLLRLQGAIDPGPDGRVIVGMNELHRVPDWIDLTRLHAKDPIELVGPRAHVVRHIPVPTAEMSHSLRLGQETLATPQLLVHLFVLYGDARQMRGAADELEVLRRWRPRPVAAHGKRPEREGLCRKERRRPDGTNVRCSCCIVKVGVLRVTREVWTDDLLAASHGRATRADRSEEHTSELQSRFGISYAV